MRSWKLYWTIQPSSAIEQRSFATRANAQAFLQVQAEFGSFDAYLWSFVDGKTIVNDVPDYRQAPAKTALSEKLAKDLKNVVLSSPDQSQFYPTYKQ